MRRDDHTYIQAVLFEAESGRPRNFLDDAAVLNTANLVDPGIVDEIQLGIETFHAASRSKASRTITTHVADRENVSVFNTFAIGPDKVEYVQ
jgi:hypothetical protein